MKKSLFAALIASSLCLPAFAADNGFYIGGSVGRSDYGVGAGDIGMTAGSVDDTDTGYKVFAGYNFTRNFGIEAAYVDLGDLTFSGNVGATPVSGSADVQGFNISAVLTAPIDDRFSVFGKLGAFVWDADFAANSAAVRWTGSGSSTDFSAGLGAAYSFNKNLSLRAEYEYFDDVDANLWTVGLAYKF